MSDGPAAQPLSPEDRKALAALDALRRRLLDLTLRNRLLNYRPSKVRGIAVVDEDPRQVFRRLVVDGKPMGFAGRPDPKGQLFPADTPPPALAPDTADDRLNTPYGSTPLEDRLLRTWTDARTVLEEQGVNTLFLAVGMITWLESEESAKPLRAPILLVPVTLDRGERGRFRLRWSGEDVGGNLSLAVKLKQDFGLDWPEIHEDEEFDLDEYLDAAERAVAGKPGWSVDRTCLTVDFFSFAKYLMFKDLDPAGWPSGHRPHEHGIVGGLLSGGLVSEGPPQPDPPDLDPVRPPEVAFEICDADSSQAVVLLDVASGKNLVVEGPPGTGKSQTIANVIAEAVASGKRVLFVAEKMAALDVVKRRLDDLKVGDACLELHSHKTRKRELLQELRRTLELPRLELAGDGEHMKQLLQARDQLNGYVRELHRPLDPSGWTPFQAQAELARLAMREEPLAKGRFEELSTCTRPAFDERRRAVRNLQAKVREIGVPAEHPYFGCRPEDLLPGDVDEVGAELTNAGRAIGRLTEECGKLADRLGVARPAAIAGVEAIARAAELLTTMPAAVLDVVASDRRWSNEAESIRAALAAGRRSREIRDEFASILLDEAWGEDVAAVRADLERSGAGWTRVFHPGFHRARKRLGALCRGGIPPTFDDRVRVVDAISEEAGASRLREGSEPLLSALCGRHWCGRTSDFDLLLGAAAWLAEFHGALQRGELPPDALAAIPSGRLQEGLSADAARVRSRVTEAGEALRKIVTRLRPAATSWGGGTDEADPGLGWVDLAQVDSWIRAANAAPGRVLEIVTYNRVRGQCVAFGLESIVALADSWPLAGDALEDVLLRTWCDGLVRVAMRDRPALSSFERASHENLVEEFRRLDREMIVVNRERVRCRHRAGLPDKTAPGATGVLREQMNLNRRHKPIRWLMRECAGPVQALKPVFMMSPLSIAMFLPPDGPRFDLVIFDEASQVRPQDSVGALLRGGQAVVVGDSHQLPPTSFFENTLSDGDEDEESEDPHVDAGEMESVLSLMRARGAQVRSLQWHYRSRHAGLIRVSGHAFYKEMQIFPSPEETAANVGLRLHHLPATVYGRGGNRSNLEEARAVAAAVLEHAKERPDLTLGVAAFSMAQQMAILRQIDALRRDHREIEAFEAAHPHEPLFVKNLENVQGDERDVILISVGYGRDERGVMTLNFGPVNQDGGERRLNVLISRARQACEIFSNFTADDLALPANAPRGVQLLKIYLKFAQTGDLDVATASGREPESGFEVAVLQFLTAQGHTVHPQVGSAGYFIDIGVVDPDQPGRYALGIECDGAKYHSARSARDRDRLREQVLRTKGWVIHRIWSTSWFQENERERRRLLAAIEATRGGSPTPPSTPPTPIGSSPAPPHVQAIEGPSSTKPNLTAPYAVARVSVNTRGKPLHEVWVGAMASWVEKIVEIESPVHVDEVIRRIREAAGVQRAGARVREAIGHAIRHSVQRGTVAARGEFLWSPGMTTPTVRDRSGLLDSSRRLELIAPEEVQTLAKELVRRAFSIEAAELVAEIARLLGFERVTPEMRSRLSRDLDALVASGRLVSDGAVLRPSDSGMSRGER